GGEVAVRDHAVQLRLAQGTHAEGSREPAGLAGVGGVGPFGGLDDVVLDDHGVAGVAAEDALALEVPPPVADGPTHQAAQDEGEERADAPEAQLARDEVEQRLPPSVDEIRARRRAGLTRNAGA